MDKKPAMLEALLNVLPAFLAFAVPIFFLPITTEFFEFNKLVLISVGTGVMLLTWVVKMLVARKVEVIRSPMDFPIIIALVVIILSTVFSLHKDTSLFGSQGRWFPSLFGLVTLMAFYYVAATNINSKRNLNMVLSSLLVGVSISSLVALLGYFGVTLGSASYFQVPNFTLTGSSVMATIFAALGVIVSFGFILASTNPSNKIFSVIAFFVNFLTVLFIGGLPSWVVLGVGLLVAFYQTKMSKIVENKGILGVIGIVSLGMVMLLVLPNSRAVLVNSDYPNEIRLDARETWIVVSSIIRDFPILGTGPSSFGLNYTRYKPLSVNTENYWNVRFDKPYSEAFGIIGAFGLVGVAISIAIFTKAVKFAFNTKKHEDSDMMYPALVGGFVALLSVLFVYYATVSLAFVLTILFVLLTVKSRLEGDTHVSLVQMSISSFAKNSGMSLAGGEKEIFQYIIALPLIALTVVGGLNLYREVGGEYYMKKSITAAQENDGSLTYRMQQRALDMNPKKDVYHNAYANTNIALANTLSSKGNLTDEEKSTVQALIAQAIRSSRIATEVLNPLSPTNWETRANIYRALIGVANDANTWTVRSFNTAIQLDPTNPRLRLNLGGVYYSTGDYLSAANMFNQATALKGDYANAHYNLAQALKQMQSYEQAQKELEITKKLVSPDSPDAQKVASEIEALSKLPAVAGATTKPTVDELSGTTPTGATPQEPITNVGEGTDTIEPAAPQGTGTQPTTQQPAQPAQQQPAR